MIKVDFNEVNAIKAPIAVSSRNGGITFVYHHCGKRIVFSKNLISKLNNPDMVRFSFYENYLIIQSVESEGFSLRDVKSSKVIYNATLIREILEHFEISCEDNSNRTFSDFEEIEGNENMIAVKMKD